MQILSSLKERPLLNVLLYIFLLILIDNCLLQQMQTPLALANWIANTVNAPDLPALTKPQSILGPSFPYWFDSFIWIVITILVYLKNKKWLYIPLTIYLSWVTFWIVGAVAILSANLWNPGSAADVLLVDGLFVWLSNVLTFAIWYWLLDNQRHHLFVTGKTKIVNFIFNQTLDNIPGWDKWTPGFIDYVFLSFNISTAFGAADALVLTKRAKALVLLQSVIALILFVVIIARAINLI